MANHAPNHQKQPQFSLSNSKSIQLLFYIQERGGTFFKQKNMASQAHYRKFHLAHMLFSEITNINQLLNNKTLIK